MKFVVASLLALSPFSLSAQNWRVNIEHGLTASRLLPSAGSTPESGSVRYGYSKPGVYIAPEVQLKINEHLDAGFNYQYANALVGVQQHSLNTSNYVYEGIDMHSFNLGLNAHTNIFRGSVKAGVYVKGGFSYNRSAQMGAGSSTYGDGVTGGSSASTSYSSLHKPTTVNAMPGAWTPTTTIGLQIGPNSKRWLADRLSFHWAAMISYVNTYTSYSYYDYTMSSSAGSASGRVQYQGIPFVMQFGIKYRIAGFGGQS
jgi:hypothetical protein